MASGGASKLIRTVDDEAVIKICKKNEEDGEILEKMVALEAGCVNHAALQSAFPAADSITYRDSDGVVRRLKRDGAAWRPPKGGVWKDDFEYFVTFPDPNAAPAEVPKKKSTCRIV